MNAPQTILPLLVAELIAAKAAEKQAIDRRVAIEAQIVALIPAPANGEGTVKDGAVKVEFKLNRKVSAEHLGALQDAWMTLNENQKTAFRWKVDIDTKQYRAIADLDAASLAGISQYITTTPAKPAVTVTPAKD